MLGQYSYSDGSYIVLKHHNYAYSYDQAINDVGGFGKSPCTVGQLIEFLKGCNPNSMVLINSDHGTIGPCDIDDIKQYDPDGTLVNDED